MYHYEIVFSQALGVMLLTFGLWLLFDRNNLFGALFSSGEFQPVACVSFMLLGVGSLIIFTSAVGFLGNVKEIRCLLVTYVCFQLLVFFTQIALSALIFMKKEVVYHQWINKIDEVISEYGNESLAEKEPVWSTLNAVQQNGCEEDLDMWFENNVLILNGIIISLLIIQVFVITLTMKLFMNIRRNSIWPNEL